MSKIKLVFIVVLMSSIVFFLWSISNKENNDLYNIDDIKSIELNNVIKITVIDSNNNGHKKIYEKEALIGKLLKIIKLGDYEEKAESSDESGGWSLSIGFTLKDGRNIMMYYCDNEVEVYKKNYHINGLNITENIYNFIYGE